MVSRGKTPKCLDEKKKTGHKQVRNLVRLFKPLNLEVKPKLISTNDLTVQKETECLHSYFKYSGSEVSMELSVNCGGSLQSVEAIILWFAYIFSLTAADFTTHINLLNTVLLQT